jgi:deoxyribodipyrimidine photo-lyase
VKEYAPELRGVDVKKIVDWPNLSPEERLQLAPEYCEPIVARNKANERAQCVLVTALGKK